MMSIVSKCGLVKVLLLHVEYKYFCKKGH